MTNSALEMGLDYLEMLLQVARAGRNNARRKKGFTKRTMFAASRS